MSADDDPRCDYCERRFIRIVRGAAVCQEHLANAPAQRSCNCDRPGDPPDIPHRPWCAKESAR